MKIRQFFERLSKRNITSKNLRQQIWGALISNWLLLSLFVIMIMAGVVSPYLHAKYNTSDIKEKTVSKQSDTVALKDSTISKHSYEIVLLNDSNQKVQYKLTGKDYITIKESEGKNQTQPCSVVIQWYLFFLLLVTTLLVIRTCLKLIEIFNLLREERRITCSYIIILSAVGFLIIGSLVIFDVKSHPRLATALGIGGTLLTWIFQDTIKGVVAFIHLRLNNLLQIGDWIQVPSHDVDGEVKRVSLTTVTIYNWDTTTSSIPTSLLHSEHFKNLQNMTEGKTHGRRMYMSFIMDTGWFHNMDEEDIKMLKQNQDVSNHLPDDLIKEGVSNAQLFRYYIYHWLMNNPHISQQPRLIVRWMEQKESGMPLQIYAFITDSKLAMFEWQQSQIVEHIITSMEWFGLRIYQSPSNYDVSNSNVFLTDNPATYRMNKDGNK